VCYNTCTDEKKKAKIYYTSCDVYVPVYSVNKCDIKQNKIMQRNCYGRYMDICINRSCVTNGWFDSSAHAIRFSSNIGALRRTT